MAIRRTTPRDRYGVCEQYLATRIRALTMPPSAIRIRLTADDQVYGAVVDMPMSENLLTTLVAYMSGTANLYFNTGGGMVGAGPKYKSVEQAAKAFMLNAGKVLPQCRRVTYYDLPAERTHYIYLMARRGVYKMEINPENIMAETPEKRMVFRLYQNLLRELRMAQLKDKAEQPPIVQIK